MSKLIRHKIISINKKIMPAYTDKTPSFNIKILENDLFLC